MNYNEALEFLLKNLPNYQRFGNSAIRPGLHNIKLLCEKFDNPQKSFKSIHIGGTNGKGTTSTSIANLCFNLKLRVGLFTSPHVFDYRERIQVNGNKIKKKFIKDFVSSNLKFFKEVKPSFFEISTLMAFEYLTNSLAGTNDFFQWFDDNLSSFGAYGNPYQDGLFAEDLLLVIGKIAIFLTIGFIGFRNRSLNLR